MGFLVPTGAADPQGRSRAPIRHVPATTFLERIAKRVGISQAACC
jgi:hypothetical protein